MFLASAARLGVAPMVWLYRNRHGVVAQQGAIPVVLKVGDAERVTGWFVETAVLESVRGKAIGPMVIAKAKQDLPLNLSLGQTPEMRAIQFTLGWQQICPLGSFALVLDPWRLLERRFPNRWLRGAAGWVLAAVQRGRLARGRRRLSWRAEAVEIARFGAEHDRLWRQVRRELPCAVVRDSSYLNWKYVEQPGQDFIRLEIRCRERLVSVVVLMIVEPSDGYPYRRGWLVDLVAPPSDRDLIWASFETARRALAERQVHLMSFDVINSSLAKQARAFGFFARQPTRFLLVSAGEASADVHRIVCSPDSWFVTCGDSDIDRPW